jgi:anti-anti-sigma factor
MQTFQHPHSTPVRAVSSSSYLSLTIDHRVGEIRLAATGEVDIATADHLTDVAIGALRPDARVLQLDLSRVSFCGAAGVTSLLEIHRAARQAQVRLVLAGIQPQVRLVLDITGTTSVIAIVDPYEIMPRIADSAAARVDPPKLGRPTTEDSQPQLGMAG